ncbi:MAG: bifunctional ADP-heptose synthase [Pyrinomonadaceae bacterium MAG19_C2-C3]|nr:bifunctional ADP-heptose synthase [Pyrinomonadaceae bacterium MAG19_C2-C3]
MIGLTNIVNAFAGKRVVVIGDLIADRFIYGEISRVSREAPVLILKHERTETVPGGAANCACNLAALGAHVSIFGVVGTDEAGASLLAKLDAANIDTGGVVWASDFTTTTKMRVLAGSAHSTKQQMIRVDYEDAHLSNSNHDSPHNSQIVRALERIKPDSSHDSSHNPPHNVAALIISDYNYGVANEAVISAARDIKRLYGTIAVVDSRYRLNDFTGFTAATPNEAEVEELCGNRFDNEADLANAGADLRRRLACDSLLITRGSHGMMLFENDDALTRIAAVGGREAVDVTGAGDTVIAAFTLALAAEASPRDAAHIANHAGGLVVMKRGTATVALSELLDALTHSSL